MASYFVLPIVLVIGLWPTIFTQVIPLGLVASGPVQALSQQVLLSSFPSKFLFCIQGTTTIKIVTFNVANLLYCNLETQVTEHSELLSILYYVDMMNETLLICMYVCAYMARVFSIYYADFQNGGKPLENLYD